MYTSQITFTLDTICPWTYLAKKRLAAALAQLPAHVTSRVTFASPTIQIRPYQLYPDPHKAFGPDAATIPPDRYAWQRDNKFLGSEETMQRFTQAMGAYGAAEGIHFVFDGPIGDTLQAHRVIWYFQEQEQQSSSSFVEEGKRRDITLVGAKEVRDYVKAMETIAKEST